MPNLKVIWKNIIEFTTDNEEARSLPDGRLAINVCLNVALYLNLICPAGEK